MLCQTFMYLCFDDDDDQVRRKQSMDGQMVPYIIISGL